MYQKQCSFFSLCKLTPCPVHPVWVLPPPDSVMLAPYNSSFPPHIHPPDIDTPPIWGFEGALNGVKRTMDSKPFSLSHGATDFYKYLNVLKCYERYRFKNEVYYFKNGQRNESMAALWTLYIKQKMCIFMVAGIWGATWNGKPDSPLCLAKTQQGSCS